MSTPESNLDHDDPLKPMLADPAFPGHEIRQVVLTPGELEERLRGQKWPRVTRTLIEDNIHHTDFYYIPDSTVIICNITLANKYSVRGESACVDKRNFDEKIGRTLAYNNAFEKLWPLFGFLLAEQLHNASVGLHTLREAQRDA